MGSLTSACCKPPQDGDSVVPALNHAFVFIKPHANVPAVKKLVETKFGEQGISILKQGSISGSVIDAKQYIDNHYYAIASKATLLSPDQLPVPADKFKQGFGEDWSSVIANGTAMNAKQACEKFGLTADELNAEWKKVTPVKFGGGFYCAKVPLKGTETYIFNAFFMTMRSKFTAPDSSIYYYSVSWSPHQLSWADFRGKVLGPTDPAKAPQESIRRKILNEWQDLGLKYSPDGSDNGVHASASPFEGLAERSNWLEGPIADDPFGKKLVGIGMASDRIAAWCKDPQVSLADGSKGSVFDTLEDINAEECLQKLAELDKANK